MNTVRSVHLLFLALRVVGVLLFMRFAGGCLGLLAANLVAPSPTGGALNHFLTPLVSGALAFWLFFFPDKIATTIQRRTGPNVSATALCTAGILLAVPAVVGLTFDVRAWLYFRTLDNAPSNPLFVYGFLPNNPVVASESLLILGGLLLFVLAPSLATLIDPDARRDWTHQRKVEVAVKEFDELD